MRNHRLEDALLAQGVTAAAVAAAVQIAPKTVGRWLADDTCVPRAEARQAVADLLGVPAAQLWPPMGAGRSEVDELQGVFPSRASVPASLVTDLVRSARSNVDIVAMSGLGWWEGDGLTALLAGRAAAGVAVRIVLADPEGEALTGRGEEEGLGELVRARSQLAWAALRSLSGVDGVSMAMHDAALPAAVIRCDDEVLANLHVPGLADSAAPVLHLRRQPGGRTVDAYIAGVDYVANRARPIAEQAAPRPARISRQRTLRRVGSGA